MEADFSFILKHHDNIANAIEHYSLFKPQPMRAQITDELWEVTYDRVPRIVELYDDTRGVKLITFVLNNLRWYFHKHVVGTVRERQTKTNLLDIHDESKGLLREAFTDDTIERDNALLVYDILAQLSDFDAYVLRMYVGEDYSASELTEVLGCSKAKVLELYHAALRRAKEVATNGKAP
jgi:hypothetical protein